MGSIDQRTLLEVDTGKDNNSLYRAIYGASKYYINQANIPEDLSIQIYKAISKNQSQSQSLNENTFISSLRNYLSSTVKFYYEKSPNKIKLQDLYINEETYNNVLDKLFGTHEAFKALYGPNNEGSFETAENKFYADLGEKIVQNNKPSQIEISALINLLSDLNYQLLTKIPTKNTDLISDNKFRLYISLKDSRYMYFTLTDEQNIKIGKPQVHMPTDLTNVNVKNSQPVYNFKKIYDTVDYFKIGVNRHQQFLNKYNLEKQIYHDTNLQTSIANVQTSVLTLDVDLNYQIDQRSLEQIKQSQKLFTQIQEMNAKNTMKLLEKTQEADEQIMNFLQYGLKSLTQTQQENIANLLLELHQGLQIQAFNANKNMMELNVSSMSGFLSLQSSIRENGENISKTLFELNKIQIEGFGSIKVNIETLLGQVKAVAKVTESVKPQLATVQNEIESELTKLAAFIEKLQRALAIETDKREKAIKAEQEMRHAQIMAEGAVRAGTDAKLYEQIAIEKRSIFDTIRSDWDASVAAKRLDNLEKTLAEAEKSVRLLRTAVNV